MPVHANSKIQLWVDEFNHAFYVSITNKENWVYTNNTGDALDAWEDYFTNLMTAINTWRNDSTSAGRTELKTRGLINALYTYKMLGNNFGTDTSQIATMDAAVIYDMGGFIPATLSRGVNYYNDMIDSPPVPPPPYTSAKMDADIASLAVGTYDTVETGKIDTAISNSASVTSKFSNDALFNDLPAPSNPPMTKQQLGEFIYVTMNYKKIKTYVPGIQGIDIPPYIT